MTVRPHCRIFCGNANANLLLNGAPRLRLLMQAAGQCVYLGSRNREPNEIPSCIENKQIWGYIHTRELPASTCGARIEQGLVTVVNNKVAVVLEDHLTLSVAVRDGCGGVPDEAGRIGGAEDDDVAIAVEVHVDALIEKAERRWGSQIELPGQPTLKWTSPCRGGEEE